MPDDDPDTPEIHGHGVRFFPYGPDMNDRIQDWADAQGVRVLSIVPVYFDEPHGGTEERSQ